MKKLLIGLIAFALTLGVACKKDEMSDPVALKVKNGKMYADPIIGTNPFGWEHVHAGTPRNSVHNPVIGYRNGGMGFICSGNYTTLRECTFFENSPNPPH